MYLLQFYVESNMSKLIAVKHRFSTLLLSSKYTQKYGIKKKRKKERHSSKFFKL